MTQTLRRTIRMTAARLKSPGPPTSRSRPRRPSVARTGLARKNDQRKRRALSRPVPASKRYRHVLGVPAGPARHPSIGLVSRLLHLRLRSITSSWAFDVGAALAFVVTRDLPRLPPSGRSHPDQRRLFQPLLPTLQGRLWHRCHTQMRWLGQLARVSDLGWVRTLPARSGSGSKSWCRRLRRRFRKREGRARASTRQRHPFTFSIRRQCPSFPTYQLLLLRLLFLVLRKHGGRLASNNDCGPSSSSDGPSSRGHVIQRRRPGASRTTTNFTPAPIDQAPGPLPEEFESVSNMAFRPGKKALNVESPSFTPCTLQQAAKKSTFSSQAASAAPFTPRGPGGNGE